MTHKLTMLTFAAAIVALGWSWGHHAPSAEAATPASGGDAYLLATEPQDAADVIPLRKQAQNQQEVAVVGRIGGRKNPWIKGVAAFMLVDRSLVPCNENRGENCPTPWDYCCSPNLAKSMVLVMLVDESGRVVRQDARELLGVKELDTIVVQGKAKRDKSGNVSVMASKVHVKDGQQATR
jgi:hypothetical protein